MEELFGRIVTDAGLIEGRIGFSTKIAHVEVDKRGADGPLIAPGFIDLHVHGGGGADCMDGAQAARQMARFHARHGTTALLATTMTDRTPRIDVALDGIAEAMADPSSTIAHILGVHLEGPFIHPDMLGAQPPFARDPDPALVRSWHAKAPIRVATMAPEIDEAGILLRAFESCGTRVQIGHSCATSAQAHAALDEGYSGFTHLFNAMTGMHHRRPGIVGCAMARAQHAEIILDLLHVEAEAVLAARRAIPELYAITDAGAAAGMPDGTYRLGCQDVQKIGDKVVLPGKSTIAGSALTMDKAFANLIGLGLDFCEASRRCSTIQADYLGLTGRGRLLPGYRADLVVMDDDCSLKDVYVGGKKVADW